LIKWRNGCLNWKLKAGPNVSERPVTLGGIARESGGAEKQKRPAVVCKYSERASRRNREIKGQASTVFEIGLD